MLYSLFKIYNASLITSDALKLARLVKIEILCTLSLSLRQRFWDCRIRPGGAGRVGRVKNRPIFPPTSIFRKRNFIRFQASLHRDGNLEIYSTMIRLAVFGRFPSTSQILK